MADLAVAGRITESAWGPADAGAGSSRRPSSPKLLRNGRSPIDDLGHAQYGSHFDIEVDGDKVNVGPGYTVLLRPVKLPDDLVDHLATIGTVVPYLWVHLPGDRRRGLPAPPDPWPAHGGHPRAARGRIPSERLRADGAPHAIPL